jgi:hypothetical protein
MFRNVQTAATPQNSLGFLGGDNPQMQQQIAEVLRLMTVNDNLDRTHTFEY